MAEEGVGHSVCDERQYFLQSHAVCTVYVHHGELFTVELLVVFMFGARATSREEAALASRITTPHAPRPGITRMRGQRSTTSGMRHYHQ